MPGYPLADAIALWPMNCLGRGIFDASGHRHTGFLQNSINWTSAGRNGFALDLSGVNGWVSVTNHRDFTPALVPFSISAWVNMRDATQFPIAVKGRMFTNGEYRLMARAGDILSFILLDESVVNGYIGRAYSVALTAWENTWIHIVATYDGGIVSNGVRIYLNGVQVDDTDQTGAGTFVSCEYLDGPLALGHDNNTYFADGLIDNVIVWRRELAAFEVALLYRKQSCMFPENIMPEFGIVA